MTTADKSTYLINEVSELNKKWPDNSTFNIVCHGHSVPSGYFATPVVDTFNAYPHLLHAGLKEMFPYAVINVIITAIGGEESNSGARRMDEVLGHRPGIITLDYSLNDRRIGLAEAEKSWCSMIEAALDKEIKVILLTPTADDSSEREAKRENWNLLLEHAQQVRRLASEYGIGLADSLREFEKYMESGGKIDDLLSQSNHPNRKGHELIANQLLEWFKI